MQPGAPGGLACCRPEPRSPSRRERRSGTGPDGGLVACTQSESWGLPQAWLIGQNPEEAPIWASVTHAGHPGLGHQLALITPNGLLALMDLQILLKLQRLIDLLDPRHAALDGRQ
jgi:hypothetical protein